MPVTLLGPDGNPLTQRARQRGQELGSALRSTMASLSGDLDSNFTLDGGFSDTAYEGASASHPDLLGFEPFNYSAQSALTFTKERLAKRIHQLVRDDGWISASVTQNLDSVIGAGWRLHSIPDFEALEIDVEVAQELAHSIEMAWRDYATDAACCDAAQTLDMGGLLALAYRHMLIDGEAFSISCWIDTPGRDWFTAIQMIDPDRLSNPHLWMDSITRKAGVELGTYGEPKGYHFRSAHPGDVGVMGVFPWIWEYLDKFYPNGRAQVVHSYTPYRAGQIRGEPPLAPILRKVRMLSKYDSAELQAAVLNALLAAFIQSPNDPDQIASSMESEDGLSPLQSNRLGFYEKAGIKMPDVKIHFMYPNDVVNLMKPEHPNANFESFLKVGLRNIASAAGITYSALTGDYSQTTYSADRSALLQVWKGFTARKGSFESTFLKPHYTNWLEEAIANGRVKLPKGAPPFRQMKNAYARANWMGPARGWVDPVKETTAAVMRISAGLSTLQQECADQNMNWREIVIQRARERQFMIDNNIDPDSLAVSAPPKGLRPGEPDPNTPVEDDHETGKPEDQDSVTDDETKEKD